MDRQDELAEYIRRAHELTKPIIESTPDGHVLGMRKYNSSEKGRAAAKRGSDLRRERMKNAIKETSQKERESIREFYYNTPEGYEVDHIIPLSRGGLHVLSNLRYCTHEENAKKYIKLLEEMINDN